MLFGLSHREKRVKKINLLHFPVFTSKKFVILKLPEPSTDSCSRYVAQNGSDFGLYRYNNLRVNACLCSAQNALRQSLDIYLANSNSFMSLIL